MEHAKEDALLQLRIGRSAHLYAVLISAALAIDGILVLLLDPNLPSLPNSASGLAALNDSIFLLIPIAAGVTISIIALVTKWEAYQLWPWEPHFSVTVGAVGLNAVIAAVYATRIAGVGSLAHLALLPWFYPVALVGISVAFLGLALTWSSWSAHQWTSTLCAVLPIASSAFVFVGTPSGAAGASGLAISLFLSAILYQTSGSFLHLISSGTRPHERELITSGQSRMFRLADEIRGKEESLHFREASLLKRESDAENAEASIARQNDSLKEGRQQLDDLELDYRKRSDDLIERERTWAGRLAEMDAQARLVEDKGKAIELREQEVGRLVPQVSAREQRLVEREAEQTRRDVEITQHAQELERRFGSLPETEARLEARRKDLDQKTAELLRREGEVVSLETASKNGMAAPSKAQADLTTREIKLQQFKAVLDEANVALGRRSRETTDKGHQVEEAQRKLAEREGGLAAREATLKQREAELDLLRKSAEDRRAQYDSASKDYTGRVDELGRQQAETAQKAADLDRTLKSVADREAALSGREQRMAADRSTLESREQILTARERRLDASEAEMGLRRAELAQGSNLSMTGMAAVAAAGRLDETSRSTSRSRASDSTTVTDLAGQPGLGTTDTLRAGTPHPDGQRLPTGIPRLDDLLVGGLPAKAHIVLLGDAFVGKEIVLYSFIAEGLKRGEPALLVTGSRSPEEVAASLGVVLPQFKDYEQLGLVTWIDASGSTAPATARRLRATGPDDRAGILTNLVKASKGFEDAKHTPFRVGFLGLSAVLAGGDPRTGLSFLQNAVGILKIRDALAMYSLEGGAISDAQVEALLSRMDGAILFRQDRDKTFLSVKGLGEVQTHDWVECRATNRALIIGSFALERIR
ncbi:MAG: ATPase domain-containing protein [Thermoplasmata archaeon]